MKRIICIILSLSFFSLTTINSFAFKVDGISKQTEWENSSTIHLLDRKESNNKINFGLVNWAIEDGSLFLCFRFIEENPPEDTSRIGVSLLIEDSDEFTVTTESSPAQSDSLEYLFEGFCTYDITNDGTCEIRVGAKYGLPSEISGKARFIDSNGSYSNVYDFTITNNTYTYYEPDYYIEPVETTTLKSTTAKQTTEISSKAEKTTKKSSSKTTKKNSSGLLGIFFNDKEETTVKQTKSDKTTKTSSEKTKKQTVKSSKSPSTRTNTTENSVAIPTSIVYITESNIAPVNNSVSTTEGTKYKILTAVFGGITLVTVAVLGTIGANKKAQKNNNKEE